MGIELHIILKLGYKFVLDCKLIDKFYLPNLKSVLQGISKYIAHLSSPNLFQMDMVRIDYSIDWIQVKMLDRLHISSIVNSK